MGNCLDCVPQRKIHSKYPETNPQASFTSTCSITNPSVSLQDESLDTTSKPSVKTSSSAKFSWTQLQSLYSESIKDNADTDNIKFEPLVLTVMKGILCIIENNIGPMSRRFCMCLTEADKTFPAYFEECAGRNFKSNNEDKEVIERIRNHTKLMIHLHRKIISALESENIGEAHDMMKLIAISHVLMKVLPSSFKFMDSVMGKFLLTNGFLFEDNAQAIVLYFSSISNYICKNMDLYQVRGETGETKHGQNSNVARENYRQMKKWHSLVQDLNDDINQLCDLESVSDVQEKPSQISHTSPVPTDILQQSACLMKHFVKKKVNKDVVTEPYLTLSLNLNLVG